MTSNNPSKNDDESAAPVVSETTVESTPSKHKSHKHNVEAAAVQVKEEPMEVQIKQEQSTTATTTSSSTAAATAPQKVLPPYKPTMIRVCGWDSQWMKQLPVIKREILVNSGIVGRLEEDRGNHTLLDIREEHTAILLLRSAEEAEMVRKNLVLGGYDHKFLNRSDLKMFSIPEEESTLRFQEKVPGLKPDGPAAKFRARKIDRFVKVMDVPEDWEKRQERVKRDIQQSLHDARACVGHLIRIDGEPNNVFFRCKSSKISGRVLSLGSAKILDKQCQFVKPSVEQVKLYWLRTWDKLSWEERFGVERNLSKKEESEEDKQREEEEKDEEEEEGREEENGGDEEETFGIPKKKKKLQLPFYTAKNPNPFKKNH